MRSFFGGTYIGKEELESNNIFYPIRLEYYKIEKEYEHKSIYGIEVVKTEYENQEKPRVTNEVVEGVTIDENEIDNILEKLKQGTVTPSFAEEIVEELSKSLNSA